MANRIYFKDRKEWRKWLAANYKKEKEIWLLYPHKDTGKPRVEYNDAVEEALCFGWIDSTVRNLDRDFAAQKFSPRNHGSPYSQANVERLKWLEKHGKLMPEVKKVVLKIINRKFIFPADIMGKIRVNKEARENFRKFPGAYQRIRVAFVEGARMRPQEFKKRLNYLIKTARQGKMFGYGGIDKYYK